jgi:hypothetical protein
VTGWKVAQAALAALKADSWESLGVRLHDVPILRDLFLIEGTVSISANLLGRERGCSHS